jgi:hypothetical protein
VDGINDVPDPRAPRQARSRGTHHADPARIMTHSVVNMAMGALVLIAFALAMSRRSLAISAGLCFLALAFMAAGFAVWVGM